MTLFVHVLLFFVLLLNTMTLVRWTGSFNVYTIDVALLPFLVAGTLHAAMAGRLHRLRLNGIDLALAATILLIGVSYVTSLNRPHSLNALFDWARIFAFYVVCRALFLARPPGRLLLIHFVAMTLFLGLLGAVQLVTGKPIGLVANYFGGDLDQGGLALLGAGDRLRVSGPTPNSNVYATWLIVFGGVPLAFLLQRGRVAAFWLCLAALSTIVLATLSRGGFAGLLVFAALLLLLNLRVLRRPAALVSVIAGGTLAVGLALFVLLAPDSLPESLSALQARQIQSRDFAEGGLRRELVEAGFELLKDPKVALVGTGADNLLEALIERREKLGLAALLLERQTGISGSRTSVHNVWLRSAVEHGIPMMLALLALHLVFVQKLFSWRRARSDSDSRAWTSHLLAFEGSYLLIGSQVYLMAMEPPIMIPLVLLMAFTASAAPAPLPVRQRERARPAAAYGAQA